MTTESEILKNWLIICSQLDLTRFGSEEAAAIRLWRMAEESGKRWAKGIEIAEARASERAMWAGVITKTEWERLKAHETDTDKFTEGTARNICRLMNEAYAKGQAELIEKIRADTKKYAKDTVWINDTMTLFDMLGIVDEDASESTSEKKGDKR